MSYSKGGRLFRLMLGERRMNTRILFQSTDHNVEERTIKGKGMQSGEWISETEYPNHKNFRRREEKDGGYKITILMTEECYSDIKGWLLRKTNCTKFLEIVMRKT